MRWSMRQALFQPGWFVVGFFLTQTLVVHMIPTLKPPLIESRAATALTLTTLAIVAMGVFLPMGPQAEHFKLQPLPTVHFAWLAAIVLAHWALATIMKRFFIRRHGWQ
jgi:Mg2+-importing ATPase